MDPSWKLFEQVLRSAGICTIYPSAPVVPYTVAGGRLQSVWFDRTAISYEAPEDKAGIARSVEQVDAEIDKLVVENYPTAVEARAQRTGKAAPRTLHALRFRRLT